MARVTLLFVLSLTLIFTVIGCSSDTGAEAKSLADVVDHLKESGLDVGDVETKAYEMLGAVDGFGIAVEGETIELYQFDPNSDDEVSKKNLADGKSIGKMSAAGFSFPAKVNGNFALIGYDTHPKKDEIVKIFEEFDTE
jgi:hypothetical protein